MARLGLAFCCLWVVVCVHGAPGYGQRDNSHDGDAGSKDAEKDRITSIALPISHTNNENGKTHTGHGAGSAGAQETSDESAKHGDHSSVRENEGSGKKNTGSRGDANDNSSKGNNEDRLKEAQSGAGKKNVNHDSSSSYGSGSGGSTGGNNHGTNGKFDNNKTVHDTSGINSGIDGGHVDISGVKGDDPSDSEGEEDFSDRSGPTISPDIKKLLVAMIG